MNRQSYFMYYKTSGDGIALEKPRRIEYADAKTLLALQYLGETQQLQHYIDLACAAPGHPVDMCLWKHGALVWSARLTYYVVKEESRV